LKQPQLNRRGDCSEESVLHYLRGELSEEEESFLADHLSVCPFCRQLLAETKELIERIRKAELPSVPDLAPSILTRLRKDTTRRNRIRTSLLFSSVAALLLISLLLWNSALTTNEDSTAETPQPPSVVQNSLNWLMRTQEPTGEWRPEKWGGKKEFTVALTGLALLALLGREGIAESEDASIQNAAEFLLRHQNIDGCFSTTKTGLMYNHAIATVALLKLYQKSRREELMRPLDHAIRFICARQAENGGWGYLYDTPNTSVSVWQLHALALAKELGCSSIERTLEKGIDWMKSLVDEHGYIGYQKKGDFPYGIETLLVMGSFSILTADTESDPHLLSRIKKSLKRLLSRKTTPPDYYQLFFLTELLPLLSEDGIDKRIVELQRRLLRRQIKKGINSGSWEPQDRWSSIGGRIYSTAMATLALQKSPVSETKNPSCIAR